MRGVGRRLVIVVSSSFVVLCCLFSLCFFCLPPSPPTPHANEGITCLVTAQDQWGGKFMDVAQEDVKAWINKSCH